MQIADITLAVVCLIVAVLALRRGIVLWHSDRRLRKNMLIGNHNTPAVNAAFERAVLPLAASSVLMGAALLDASL